MSGQLRCAGGYVEGAELSRKKKLLMFWDLGLWGSMGQCIEGLLNVDVVM
jgi:hypothetical protein